MTAAAELDRLEQKLDDALAARLPGMDKAAILAAAAALQENPVRDETYKLTPIGRLIDAYLQELRFLEYAPKTVTDREYILSQHALALAHLEPGDVTPAHLDDYKNRRWAGLEPNTKQVYISTIRVFWKWAHDNDHIPTDPGRRLKGPRQKDSERPAHDAATLRRLVLAQPSHRDRVALLTMYWCGLRRNELRVVQFKHIDMANRELLVFGKGGTVVPQNIPDPLALELERHILDRQPDLGEYLLYPQKVGRFGTWPLYTWEVISEKRMQPLTISGIDKWWQRCLARSGLPHMTMHELRHTAGTDFHKTSRDYAETQHFMRHKDPATTIRTYIHLDRVRAVSDVQRRMADPLGGGE